MVASLYRSLAETDAQHLSPPARKQPFYLLRIRSWRVLGLPWLHPTYALAPTLVEMLTEAVARAQAWSAGRKAARRAYAQARASGRRESTSSRHRVSPPSVGEAFKAASSDSGPARGRVGQAIGHARALAVALGRTGEECEHDTVPSRCGICRHRTGKPAAVP